MENTDLRKRFIKNTSWILFFQVFTILLSFIISAMSARVLGTYKYGVINYSLSIMTLLMSFATLGLDSVMVNELISKRESNGKLIGSGIVLRIVTSIAVIICILIIVGLLNPNDKLMVIVALLQSISLIFRSFDLIDYWFQSNLESKYSTIVKTIVSIFIAIFKIIILYTNKSIYLFAFSVTIDAIIVAILYMYIYNKKGGQKLEFSIIESKQMVNSSKYFIISTFFVSLYSKIDQIMIGNMITSAAVGIYAVAIVFESSWYFIPMALITSSKAVIFNKSLSKEERDKKIKKLYFIIFWMGIIVAIIFSFSSEFIITAMYGSEYIKSIAASNIIIWAGAFAMTGSVRALWLLSEGKQKYTIYFVVSGAVVNIVLNLFLIPTIGISGAAIATLITQIFQVTIIPLFFKETRECIKVMMQGIFLDFNEIKNYFRK